MLKFSSEGIRESEMDGNMSMVDRLRDGWKAYIAMLRPYPTGRFKGRGIVMCAGGIRYLTCAWVAIHQLRRLGCSLPIEIWHNGYAELTPEIVKLLSALDVQCMDATSMCTGSARGFALKANAVLNSRFEEVLFLDADNNCISDPSWLFDTDQFIRHGAIFWPDLWTTHKKNPIWRIVECEADGSNEQESGQLLINKRKAWEALNLAVYFNQNRDVYYKMLLGDKDTFRFAWLALRESYFFISGFPGLCGYVDERDGQFRGNSLVQHDPNGNILFIHRNSHKWDITARGERVWKEIRRFKAGAEHRVLRYGDPRPNDRDNMQTFDMQGDIDRIDFTELFGTIEETCLSILCDLRDQPFYARFMLHQYFIHFRPGYSGPLGLAL